jgi:hypothetical protein
MSTRAKELFPQFPTHYLKAIGELLLCGIALQATIDAGAPCTESWYLRANGLVDESMRIGEALSRAGNGVVRVELSDGSTVVADADYLNRLVRRMHRHRSLGTLQATGTVDEELIAS